MIRSPYGRDVQASPAPCTSKRPMASSLIDHTNRERRMKKTIPVLKLGKQRSSRHRLSDYSLSGEVRVIVPPRISTEATDRNEANEGPKHHAALACGPDHQCGALARLLRSSRRMFGPVLDSASAYPRNEPPSGRSPRRPIGRPSWSTWAGSPRRHHREDLPQPLLELRRD
jgi:hypothetical protein